MTPLYRPNLGIASRILPVLVFIGAILALSFAVYVLGLRVPPATGERQATAALIITLVSWSVVFLAYAAGGRPVLVGPPSLRSPLLYRLLRRFRAGDDVDE
jgi:hypothetical protein